ncbi:ABC transporter permease subunit [Candidatus Thioglobus sp.]|jgi:general L-amino acid transport system permease protein|nr:ABC transporter permease subunit [Candidatus Thioglobus sp.]
MKSFSKFSNLKNLSFKELIYNNEIRALLIQVLTVVIIFSLFYVMIQNLNENIEARGIVSGFTFLEGRSGFDILPFLGSYIVKFSPNSTNLEVFYVAIINTLVCAGVGIILSTILGVLIGIARLSTNYLISRLANAYIELFRNIPILLQILFWYNIFLNALPIPKKSISLLDVMFINNRGFYLPNPIPQDSFLWVSIAFVIGVASAIYLKRHFKRKQDETGQQTNTIGFTLGLIIVFPVVVFLLLGSPLQFDYAVLGKFNLKGGLAIVPEFVALTLALSVYTATYIAEAIRSGIEAVDKGQKEAAAAIGLTKMQALKLIILPQALRVAIPPTINQYLNLTKNSSLAAAIGYPELMSAFGGTVLNQVGQAIEILTMVMLVYLVISLLISVLLNYVNKKMAIQGR